MREYLARNCTKYTLRHQMISGARSCELSDCSAVKLQLKYMEIIGNITICIDNEWWLHCVHWKNVIDVKDWSMSHLPTQYKNWCYAIPYMCVWTNTKPEWQERFIIRSVPYEFRNKKCLGNEIISIVLFDSGQLLFDDLFYLFYVCALYFS